MIYETKDKGIHLIKELVEEKKNLHMRCENLHRESIKMVKEQVCSVKSAIAAQEAKLAAERELKKLKNDIASSNIVIHDLEKQVEELHAKGNAAVEAHAKSKQNLLKAATCKNRDIPISILKSCRSEERRVGKEC